MVLQEVQIFLDGNVGMGAIEMWVLAFVRLAVGAGVGARGGGWTW